MSTQIQTNNWAEFKSLIASKSLLIQYGDSDYAYDVYAVDGQIIYNFSVVKTTPASSDQTDFESNYKPFANQILDIERVLLSQEVSQLSQLIQNTGSGASAIPLESQQVVQLSNLNIAVVTEIAQITTTLLYESQQVTQLSQIITNTGATIDTRPLLSQEITQLSTLELYAYQQVGQLSNLNINVVVDDVVSSAQVTQLTTIQLYGSQEVSQLSTIITNTSVAAPDPRPLLSQEVTQLSNLNAEVIVEVTQLSTLNLYGSQEVAQLSTIIANTSASATIDTRPYLSAEITQLTTVQSLLTQEASQLTTLITNTTGLATSVNQSAQSVLLIQEVSQLSQIITNTGLENAENVLTVQQVTQLSNLNAAVALEVTQLTTINITIAQEVAQLSTLNSANNQQAVNGLTTNVLLSQEISQLSTLELYGSQEVAQLSTIITNTSVAAPDLRPLLAQEITQLSNLNTAVVVEVTQLTTLQLYGSQEVAQLSQIITNTATASGDPRPLLAQEVTQLSNLNTAVVVEVTQLTTLQLYGSQEVAQLSQIITNTATASGDPRPLLAQEVTQLSNLNVAVALEISQLTTINTTLAQEVAQLSTLNTTVSTATKQDAQTVLLAQEVAQLSTITTNTAGGSGQVPLLSQEVAQLTNLNAAVALEVSQLSMVNVVLTQEAAQLTTLNATNTSQVVLLSQQVSQLSTIATNTAGSRTQDGSGSGITGIAIGPKYALDVNFPGAYSSATITTGGQSVAVPTINMSTVIFTVLGTWTGHFWIQGSTDNGLTWLTINGNFASSGMMTGISSSGVVTVQCAGYTNVRLYADSWSLGTANVTWASGAGMQLQQVYNVGTPTALQATVYQPTGTNLHAVIDSSALPSGAATSAKQPAFGTAGTPSADVVTIQGVGGGIAVPISANSSNFVGKAQLQDNTGAAITLGQKGMTNSVPVVIASDDIVQVSGVITSNLAGYSYSSYSPDPGSYPVSSQTTLAVDAVGRLETHSTCTTDEGSFRDDFSGAGFGVALTGTLNFTNGLVSVTGSGTSFTTEVVSGSWIKKSTDGETFYAQVDHVSNDTQLFLVTPYAGVTASGVAGVVSKWKTSTGTGGSIGVASSIVTLGSGTTSLAVTSIQTPGDYLPYTLTAYAAISQRIANQTSIIGFADQLVSPNKQCLIQFTGTVNTTLSFITAFSSAAADIQTTAVTLPNGGTTNNYHIYKIDLSSTQATLSIDGIIVAVNSLHLPGPYDLLAIGAKITNTAAAASNTNLTLDYFGFSNWDRVQIDSDFPGEPLPVTISPSSFGQTGESGTGSAQTITLPAAPGYYHYITFIGIELYSTAARTGSATPIRVTTTNFPASYNFTFQTAGVIGAVDRQTLNLSNPIRSAAVNTATTIVCPTVTNGIWRVNVAYYVGA